MQHIFKALFGTALVFAVGLYLVMGRQAEQKVDVKVEQVSMDRDVAEFNKDFEKGAFKPMTSVIHREQRKIDSANAKLDQLHKEQDALKQKNDEINGDFDKAMKSMDNDLGGKSPTVK